MKVIFTKQDLLEVLSKVQGLTGRRTSLAITEDVLLRAEGDEVKIAATDLETGFEGIYPAEVILEGTAAVNSRKLYDIVRIFPSEKVQIEEQENRWIAVTSDTVEYHLLGMDPEEFPDIPGVEEADFFEMEAESLKVMIEKSIAINVSGEERRVHMTGARFEKIADDSRPMVRMVSTDTKRLAKVDYVCGEGRSFSAGQNVIVPKKGLAEVNKFLNRDDNVHVGIESSHFIVRRDSETLVINLLEGDFPPYESLLEIDREYDIKIPKDSFLMMLRRMSIVTSEEYRAVIFNFNSNKLEVRAVNPNVGESKEVMDIEYDREPLETAFNPRYFIEAVNFIENEQVVLNIVDREHPCIVRGEENEDYLNIIMPMKI